MDEQQLADVAERWLTSLPQDLKDFLHVVCDDLELEESVRSVALCAVLYTLTPGDVIPDSTGVPGYIDDALALRVALEVVQQRAPARFATYAERIPELTDSVGADLDAFRALLGELYPAFVARVADTDRYEFKGKTVKDLLADDDGTTWLDEEVAVVAPRLEFKPAAVQSAARRVASLLPTFRQKLQGARR